jgi:hypothetical protein
MPCLYVVCRNLQSAASQRFTSRSGLAYRTVKSKPFYTRLIMQLYRLVYCSEASDDLMLPDIMEISRKASVKNRQQLLSGGLLFCEGKFLQVLEGGIESINTLYRKLFYDRRHVNISLIGFSKISKRRFDGWEMSLIFFASSKEFQGEYQKYSASDVFDPLYIEPESAVDLLKELLTKKQNDAVRSVV